MNLQGVYLIIQSSANEINIERSKVVASHLCEGL